MKKTTYIIIYLIINSLLAPANDKEILVNQLLSEELKKSSVEKLPISWVFSREGGAIILAELDIVGDERKEIVYDRTIRGLNHKSQPLNDIFFKEKEKENFIKIKGKIPLYAFYKKNGKESIFLLATEGRNFDTANEKSFTKKLIIKEVTMKGVEDKIHVINIDSSDDLKQLWKAVILPHQEKSIKFMRDRGFTLATPKFAWVSVKDYLSKNYKWKVYDINDWSALNEFSTGAQTWRVHKSMITPDYLELARNARKNLNQGEEFVDYGVLDLPQHYFSPKKAYRILLEKN